MKPTTKELVLSSLAAAALAAALFYFLSGLQQGKKAGGNDLFAGVPADCRALLYMKKNAVFARWPSHPVIDSTFGKMLPAAYRTIIGSSPRHASFLVAFCPEGALLYGRLSPGEFSAVRREALRALSNGYPPRLQRYLGSKIEYYPLKGADFLGCYYGEGLLIAGGNKKLLEKAVARCRNASAAPGTLPAALRKELDARVSVCLLLKAAEFGLDLFDYPPGGDPGEGWVQADLTWRDETLGGFGSVPGPAHPADSAACDTSLADTLAVRLQRLLPGVQVDARLNRENGRLYYAVGAHLPVSTVNPSNE